MWTHPRPGMMTEESMDTTKVQLDEPMSFIRVTFKSTGEGLFPREEMTQ